LLVCIAVTKEITTFRVDPEDFGSWFVRGVGKIESGYEATFVVRKVKSKFVPVLSIKAYGGEARHRFTHS